MATVTATKLSRRVPAILALLVVLPCMTVWTYKLYVLLCVVACVPFLMMYLDNLWMFPISTTSTTFDSPRSSKPRYEGYRSLPWLSFVLAGIRAVSCSCLHLYAYIEFPSTHYTSYSCFLFTPPQSLAAIGTIESPYRQGRIDRKLFLTFPAYMSYSSTFRTI